MPSVIYKKIIILWDNLRSKLRTEKLSLPYFIQFKNITKSYNKCKKKNRDFDPDWPHGYSIFMVSVHIMDSFKDVTFSDIFLFLLIQLGELQSGTKVADTCLQHELSSIFLFVYMCYLSLF